MSYAPPQRKAAPAAPRALQRRRAGGEGRGGPAGAAQSRLQASLDGSPRVAAQSRRADELSARLSRAPAPGGTIVQRTVYTDLDSLLAATLGGPVPDLTGGSLEVLQFLADAESLVGLVDVVPKVNLQRAAEIKDTPGAAQPYRLKYNPNWQDRDYLLASIIHELLHAAVERQYRWNGAPNVPEWTNLNLPPGLGPTTVLPELAAQTKVLGDNIDALDKVLEADKTLPRKLKAHLGKRVAYAGEPGWHYDTVIADMLVYMELLGYRAGPTYEYLRRLAAEANDRRRVAPYWGVKRARPVDPSARRYQFWKW
jgi:hypothetical protein